MTSTPLTAQHTDSASEVSRALAATRSSAQAGPAASAQAQGRLYWVLAAFRLSAPAQASDISS